AIPLPFSVRRGAIEPTIVTSSPSRIQTVPSPMTTSQWNFAHGSRSSRAGMFVLIRPVSTLALSPLMWIVNDDPTTAVTLGFVVSCRLLGHRYRFEADEATMRWTCERGCGAGGSKEYASAEEAS